MCTFEELFQDVHNLLKQENPQPCHVASVLMFISLKQPDANNNLPLPSHGHTAACFAWSFLGKSLTTVSQWLNSFIQWAEFSFPHFAQHVDEQASSYMMSKERGHLYNLHTHSVTALLCLPLPSPPFFIQVFSNMVRSEFLKVTKQLQNAST